MRSLSIWALFILMIGLPITFGIAYQSASMMTAAVLPGASGLIALNIGRFRRVKAGPIEAEMYEILEEAKASLQQLQSLARITATTLLSTVQMTGRMGGFRDESKDAIRDEVLGILDELGIPQGQQDEAMAWWHACVEFDYALAILGGCWVPSEALKIDQSEWNQYHGSGILGRPNPEQLRGFLSKHDLLTPTNEERLEDYEFYCRERRHRRPDEWARREGWHLS